MTLPILYGILSSTSDEQNVFISLQKGFYIEQGWNNPYVPKLEEQGTKTRRLYEEQKEHTMNRLKQLNAQSLLEYAIVVSLVTAAMAAMSTYVFRSTQATQKAIDTAFLEQ